MKVLSGPTTAADAKNAHVMRIGREGTVFYSNTSKGDMFELCCYEMQCARYFYDTGTVFVREGAFSVSRTTARHTLEFLKFAVYNGAYIICLEDATVTRGFKEFCSVNHVSYLTQSFEDMC